MEHLVDLLVLVVDDEPDVETLFTPDSAMVGRSGASGERVRLVTPNARSLPSGMSGSRRVMLSNVKCTASLNTAVTDSPPLRYDTPTTSTPVRDLKSSAVRCGRPPS